MKFNAKFGYKINYFTFGITFAGLQIPVGHRTFLGHCPIELSCLRTIVLLIYGKSGHCPIIVMFIPDITLSFFLV